MTSTFAHATAAFRVLEPARAFAFALVLLAHGGAQAAGETTLPVPAPVTVPPRVDAAMVIDSSGDTRLQRPTAMLNPVRVGEIVRAGDRVLTGPDGRVELRFLDGAVLAVQPGSDFRIEAYRYDTESERSFLQLVKGAIRTVSGAIGKRNRDDYRMTTPTATIGIRGTEYEAVESTCGANGSVACLPGERTGLVVRVIHGRVAVSNVAGTTEVPEGRTLVVRNQAAPAAFEDVEPAPARAPLIMPPAPAPLIPAPVLPLPSVPMPAVPVPAAPAPAAPAPDVTGAASSVVPWVPARRGPRGAEPPVRHIDVAPVPMSAADLGA